MKKDYASFGKDASVDKKSEIPYYSQLKKIITEEINSGRWRIGQQILPENNICELFGISRTVVRQAYQELTSEGYLVKEKARGTYVAKPKISENLVQRLIGSHDDLVLSGYKINNIILEQRKTIPQEPVTSFLKTRPGEEVIVLKRVRKINGEPLIVVTSYIPYGMCPAVLEEDFSEKSLYEYLRENCNLEIHIGMRFIEAVTAGEKEAGILNVDKGAPLLQLESVSFLKNGTVAKR